MKVKLCCALLSLFLIASVSAVISPIQVKTTMIVQIKPNITGIITLSPSQTAAQWGSLEVYSSPSGAKGILYKGDWYHSLANITTPLYLPVVPVGTYGIMLQSPGYRMYNGNVTIQDGQPAVLSVTLDPLAVPTNQVSQVPSAQTDSLVTSVPETLRQVEVEPTGPGPADSSSESTGSLSITTTPPGAEISIDNEVKGISPAMISGLAAGTHSLNLTKAGYKDFSTTIGIDPGKVREYSTGLTELASPAVTAATNSTATPAAKSPGFALVAALAVISIAVFRKTFR